MAGSVGGASLIASCSRTRSAYRSVVGPQGVGVPLGWGAADLAHQLVVAGLRERLRMKPVPEPGRGGGQGGSAGRVGGGAGEAPVVEDGDAVAADVRADVCPLAASTLGE